MVTSRKVESIANRFGHGLNGIYCDGCNKQHLQVYYHCEECEDFDHCEDCRAKGGHDWHAFAKRFSSLRVRISAKSGDIQEYVKRRIEVEEDLKRMLETRWELQTRILDTVIENAQGMYATQLNFEYLVDVDRFLLARFHMDALADCLSVAEIETALKNLPQEIDDTYSQAMKRIEKLGANRRRAVKRLLQWVSYAKRPLTTAELEHATAASRGVREIQKDNIISAKGLTSLSAGIVIIDENGHVRLTHKTAEDYFSKQRATLFSDGDIEIAEFCLAYLQLSAFETGPCEGPDESDSFAARLKDHPFYGYASLYWGDHARACASDIVTPQALMFLRNEKLLEASVQALWYTDMTSADSWDATGGIEALHFASFFGLNDIAKGLLREGANPNTRDTAEATPLIYACAQGHAQTVDTLLKAGAHAHLVDKRGSTALLRSIKKGHLEVTRRLLQEKNVAINTIYTSFYNYTALMLACWKSDPETVKLLLQRPDIDVNMSSPPTRYNPLLLSANDGEDECVEALLQHPAIDKNVQDRPKYTPTSYAALSGHVASLKLLLKAGADPDIKDDQGGRPLQRAIDYGRFPSVKVLLDHNVEYTFRDMLGRTILHAAAVNNRSQILRLILETCRDLDIDTQGDAGETALHDASRRGFVASVKVLLEFGARTDVMTKAGRTPVRIAMDANQSEVLSVLRDARAKEDEAAKKFNANFLRKADTFGFKSEIALESAVQTDSIETLRSRIARTNSDELNEGTEFKATPLHSVCETPRFEVAQLLLEGGAFVDPMDAFFRTPLIIACQRRATDIVQLLVKHGANVNHTKFSNSHPWEIALRKGGSKTAIYLLGLPQTEINANSVLLSRALGWAAALGNLEACKRLVAAGAPLHIKNTEGMTPVQIAKGWDQDEVERFLREEGTKRKAVSSPELPTVDTTKGVEKQQEDFEKIKHPPRRSPTTKKEYLDLVEPPELHDTITATSHEKQLLLGRERGQLFPSWVFFVLLGALAIILASSSSVFIPQAARLFQ